jgi:hypothetical protein
MASTEPAASGKQHVLHRLGHRLRAALANSNASIVETGLDVAGLGTVRWRDLLAIDRRKEQWRAYIRCPDGDQRCVSIGRLSKEDAGQLRSSWQADLVAAARRDGYLEGATISRVGESNPGCNTALFLTGAIAAVPLGWWAALAIWSRASLWLEPAQVWTYMTPMVAGAVVMIAILLLVALSSWRELQQTGSWQRWRIDRHGLSVPSPDGSWAMVRLGPGDRIGDDAVIGGEPVPIGLFSGGELSSKLLIATARRQGAKIDLDNRFRNTALRCLLLWSPLLAAGWLAFFRITGQPIDTAHWMILGYGGALLGLVGLGSLWIHIGLRKHLRRLAAEAEELLDDLGWSSTDGD